MSARREIVGWGAHVRTLGVALVALIGAVTVATSPATVSAAVAPSTSTITLAAGGDHACAVLTTGAVKCWGDNAAGQLGNKTLVTTYKPGTAVAGLTTATSIAAGSSHSCAALADGTARCWGGNYDGGLGNGTSNNATAPVAVKGLSGVASVTTGWEHSCALLRNGAL